MAKIEREMAEQSKKFVDELNDLRNENTQVFKGSITILDSIVNDPFS